MKNIAIVEDEDEAAARLTGYIERYAEQNGQKYRVERFNNAVDFLAEYKSIYSVVFMDIQMPNMDGMSAAAELRRIDKTVSIVFITNLIQYAQKGYEVNALDFIVKPIGYSEFKLKMRKAVNVARSREIKSVLVPVNSGFCRISIDKLVYVEVMGHKLKYQLVDEEIEARGTLGEVEKKLDGCGFLRCNSCYLVNSRYVNKVRGNEVDVGGHVLKISHPKRKAFVEALMEIFTGGG